MSQALAAMIAMIAVVLSACVAVNRPPRATETEPTYWQPGGRGFQEAYREAVVGSFAADHAGLSVGSTFQPSHGLNEDSDHVHKEEYVVVGILEPTNTPIDKVIFIPIEGIFRMDGHVLRGGGEEYVPAAGQSIPEEHREVSAVLVDLANPQLGFSLLQQVNREGKVATLAFPIGRVVGEIFEKMGWAHRLLSLISSLVMVIAACSILTSLVQTISLRSKDFAILRAMGMPRKNLIWLMVVESGLLALLGSLAGFLIYGLVLWGAAILIRAQTGVVISLFSFHPVFVWGPACMTLLGAAAGLLPAWKAYHTPVCDKLAG